MSIELTAQFKGRGFCSRSYVFLTPRKWDFLTLVRDKVAIVEMPKWWALPGFYRQNLYTNIGCHNIFFRTSFEQNKNELHKCGIRFIRFRATWRLEIYS